jgi:hypothetical protein
MKEMELKEIVVLFTLCELKCKDQREQPFSGMTALCEEILDSPLFVKVGSGKELEYCCSSRKYGQKIDFTPPCATASTQVQVSAAAASDDDAKWKRAHNRIVHYIPIFKEYNSTEAPQVFQKKRNVGNPGAALPSPSHPAAENTKLANGREPKKPYKKRS